MFNRGGHGWEKTGREWKFLIEYYWEPDLTPTALNMNMYLNVAIAHSGHAYIWGPGGGVNGDHWLVGLNIVQ